MNNQKAFYEDMFIIAIILGVIYGIYSLFSSDEDIVKKDPIIKVIQIDKNETIKNKKNKDTNNTKVLIIPKDEKVLTSNISSKIEIIKPKIKKTELSKTVKIQEVIKKEKKVNNMQKIELTTEKLYANLKKQIYKNIEGIKYNNSILSTKVKLTILKDGRYEQIVFVSGDRVYFNNIQSSIAKIFPIKIEEKLRGKFPRYFRFEIIPNKIN